MLQWYDKPDWDNPTDEEMEGYPYGEIEFTNYPPHIELLNWVSLKRSS